MNNNLLPIALIVAFSFISIVSTLALIKCIMENRLKNNFILKLNYLFKNLLSSSIIKIEKYTNGCKCDAMILSSSFIVCKPSNQIRVSHDKYVTYDMIENAIKSDTPYISICSLFDVIVFDNTNGWYIKGDTKNIIKNIVETKFNILSTTSKITDNESEKYQKNKLKYVQNNWAKINRFNL
jgi:hypothetical protein